MQLSGCVAASEPSGISRTCHSHLKYSTKKRSYAIPAGNVQRGFICPSKVLCSASLERQEIREKLVPDRRPMQHARLIL
jgi:hypothetical protein